MQPVFIEARDIPDAWFQCVYNIFDKGRIYTIQQGSFAGNRRLEYEHITVRIIHPGARPLIPDMPSSINIPPPTDMEYVESYLEKLITSFKADHEEYTYGEYLEPQIPKIVRLYKECGHNTNQGYMTVGDRECLDLADPPCLRGIDTRILDGKLHFILYFRSWDLWAGFPSNLAALQLLKEDMAAQIGVGDGEIIAASKGMHLYDYVWDIAKLRTGCELKE